MIEPVQNNPENSSVDPQPISEESTTQPDQTSATSGNAAATETVQTGNPQAEQANPSVSAEKLPTVEQLTEKQRELEKKLAETEKRAGDNWDMLVRQRAEYENLQKRVERDLEKAHKFALEKFVTELLSVKDSMEMGVDAASKPETSLEAMREGVELTLKMLGETMKKFEVEEINPQDQKFDPQWHEAMAMQPIADVEEGTVVIVHQKGYRLHERLLRPARVIVAKTPEASEQKPLEN